MNIKNIKKLKSEKTTRLIKAIALRDEINVKALQQFRSYFWKDIDDIFK